MYVDWQANTCRSPIGYTVCMYHSTIVKHATVCTGKVIIKHVCESHCASASSIILNVWASASQHLPIPNRFYTMYYRSQCGKRIFYSLKYPIYIYILCLKCYLLSSFFSQVCLPPPGTSLSGFSGRMIKPG